MADHKLDFEIEEKEGELIAVNLDSFLRYNIRGNVMLITSTYTEPEYRGRGIAGYLTQHAIELAQKDNLKIVPICPYVDVYMKRNGYEDMIYHSEEQ